MGLQLGIDQCVIHTDFKAATVRRDERERFDLGFEFFEQFCR
jgi:hypothetical protein